MYLGLDLATKTGWATWTPGEDRPHTGTLRLARWDPDEIAPDLERLRRHLSDLHAANPIAAVWYEAPIMLRVDKQRTVQYLFGLANMVEWWSYRLSIPCKQADMRDWRKHFFGRSTGGRAELKQAALDACKLRGWSVNGDDEADAAGVLDYGLACIGADVPWRDIHLFGGRAVA